MFSSSNIAYLPFPPFCDSFGGDIGVIFFSTNIPVNNFLLLVIPHEFLILLTNLVALLLSFLFMLSDLEWIPQTVLLISMLIFFIWESSKSFPCWPQFLVSKDLWLLHPLLTVSDISIPQELVNTIFFHSLLCRVETIGPALNGALEPPTTQEPDSPLAYLCPAF